MTSEKPAGDAFRERRLPVVALLVLPLAGLALLLARPEFDVEWEHHPSHFWLVLVTAAVNVALAYLTNIAAGRYRDARLVLVSLAFLSSAGFLGLHALATPGVLLPHPNTGFVVATPVGLVIASLFALASISPLAGPRAANVLRRRTLLLAALLALMGYWAFLSLARLAPLDGPPPAQEGFGLLAVLAAEAVAVYGYTAWRYLLLYRERGGIVPLAVAISLVLLAEAMIAVTLSRNWHLSWWEWHLLMLAAFAAIALGARQEYNRSGSLTAAFGGLYLEATLARVDRWHAGAIAAVANADERGEPQAPSSHSFAARVQRATKWPCSSGRRASCDGSMPCSGRTCPRWSPNGSVAIAGSLGSMARSVRSARCSPTWPPSPRSAKRVPRPRCWACSTSTGPSWSRSAMPPAESSSTLRVTA